MLQKKKKRPTILHFSLSGASSPPLPPMMMSMRIAVTVLLMNDDRSRHFPAVGAFFWVASLVGIDEFVHFPPWLFIGKVARAVTKFAGVKRDKLISEIFLGC